MKTTIRELGWVNLDGKVIVSDPCYDRDVWCMINGLPVKPGMYKAVATYSDEGDWGVRVANLALFHADYPDDLQNDWESVSGSIGVDSGQCGIFDDSIYPQSKDHPDNEPFYDECCAITACDISAGILADGGGVVSSSGIGDGCYELLGKTESGRYIALMLDFGLIEEEEDDED